MSPAKTRCAGSLCVRVLEEEQALRRTIADAIDVLCNAADFEANDRAGIRVGLLKLPSGLSAWSTSNLNLAVGEGLRGVIAGIGPV